MILTRKKSILYFHGFMCPLWKDEIYVWLKKYLPEYRIDRIQLSSNPEKDIPKFQKQNYNKYIATVGHSMGGLYSSCIPGKPSFLINPGFGISKRESKDGIDFSKFSILEGFERSDIENVYGFFGKQDPKLWLIKPFYIRKFGKKNIEYFNGFHVPKENNIRDIIVPRIKEVLN